MTDASCLDDKYSTTRLVTRQKREIVSNSEDKFETVLFLPKDTKQQQGGLRTKGYFKSSYNEKPLVTVVTVVYNGEKFLEKTIKSVINQTYDNVEYIIIDGGSTDGTIEVIKKYEDYIDYWVSEQDSGIYDAMNKGLILATGKVVSIINADDWYLLEAVEKSISAIYENGVDYSVGNVRLLPSEIVAKSVMPLKKDYLYQGMVYPHITAFIRMKVYKTVGLFNTRYKIAADFDMAQRIHLRSYEAIYIDELLAIVMEGGVSGGISSKKEYREIAISHGKPLVKAYGDYFIQLAKYIAVRVLPKKIVSTIFHFRKSRFQYDKS